MKVCKVSPAGVQGWQANFEKWSVAMTSASPPFRPQWLPLFLDESGEEVPLKAGDKKTRPRGNSGSADWGKTGGKGGASPMAANWQQGQSPPWMQYWAGMMMPMPSLPMSRSRAGTASSVAESAAGGAADAY